MTELEMGMIGLVAFAIVGVLAYNKWEEMRQRKSAEQALRTRHPDVLLDGPVAQEEPGLTRDVNAEDKEHEVSSSFDERTYEEEVSKERIEPVLLFDPEPYGTALSQNEDEDVAPPSPTHSQTVPDFSLLLSSQIDFIAAIDTVDPIAASGICQAQREIQGRIKRSIHWIGYNKQAARWEVISEQSQTEYQHIRVGLQLVDRQGSVSEKDLTRFATAVQDLADQFSGVVDLPPHQPAHETAVKLDEFCASVDVQIGINVISRDQTFLGTKLRALAEVAGMTLNGGKRFASYDEEGNMLFVLLNQDAAGFSDETMKTLSTQGVTFLLDVPCVTEGDRVFNQMVALAQHFAKTLNGELVDDNLRPLSETSLEPIRQQIIRFQSLLTERNLPPGSPLTRRLFS